MNVPFFLRDERARRRRSSKAPQARGLMQLKGHRAVGGMRASIYNAMPLEGVRALVDWMREFEQRAWLTLPLQGGADDGARRAR